MNKLSVPFYLLILIHSLSFAQSAKEQLAIANSAKLTSQNFYEEIPFEDKLGYFIIKVKIDSVNYDYIFDTGGYNTVTSAIMENAQLPELMEVEVGSSNKIKSKIKLSIVPFLQIGKVTFQDVGVFNFDFTDSPIINCYTNGGLIGKSVIREAVWQIDYRDSIIRISDDIKNMPNIEKGERMKISLDKVFNPFLQLSISGKKETFLLDLGFGGLLSLTEKTAHSLNPKSLVTIEGEGTVGANGTVKENTFLMPIENIKIGTTELRNQTAFFSKSNNYNLLGSELTKYFIVTLNLKDKELILTPYNDKSTPFETFGFDINVANNKFYINRVYNGLVAQKAGLQLNDEVIRINDQNLAGFSDCDGYFFVKKLLSTAKEIKIQVRRNNEEMEFEIINEKK